MNQIKIKQVDSFGNVLEVKKIEIPENCKEVEIVGSIKKNQLKY